MPAEISNLFGNSHSRLQSLRNKARTQRTWCTSYQAVRGDLRQLIVMTIRGSQKDGHKGHVDLVLFK
eukprot:4449582-Lingulodinium_polyedra.AAC.1